MGVFRRLRPVNRARMPGRLDRASSRRQIWRTKAQSTSQQGTPRQLSTAAPSRFSGSGDVTKRDPEVRVRSVQAREVCAAVAYAPRGVAAGRDPGELGDEVNCRELAAGRCGGLCKRRLWVQWHSTSNLSALAGASSAVRSLAVKPHRTGAALSVSNPAGRPCQLRQLRQPSQQCL
jgi:hypothetical protein